MAKVIQVSDETYKELVKRGSYNDTMDTIVSRLLAASGSESRRE